MTLGNIASLIPPWTTSPPTLRYIFESREARCVDRGGWKEFMKHVF